MKTKYDQTIQEASQAMRKATQLKLAEDEDTDRLHAHNTSSRSPKLTRITEVKLKQKEA